MGKEAKGVELLHTCGRKPNDDGRLTTDCEGCWEQAYRDGKGAGLTYAMVIIKNATMDHIQREQRHLYDPQNPPDEREADAVMQRSKAFMAAATIVARALDEEIDRHYKREQ